MKKQFFALFFVHLVVITVVRCQDNGFTLLVTFDTKNSYEKIYLWKVRGMNEDLLDSIFIRNKKALWKADTLPTTGEYRISTQLRYDDGWYFIINQEPFVHLHINWKNQIESNFSEENARYFHLQKYQIRLDSLQARGDYYYQTKRFDQLNEVKVNLKKVIREYYQAVDSFSRLYPFSFAVKVHYASVPPLFELYKKEHPNQPYPNEYAFLKKHLFDRIDKYDSRFVHTRVISRAIEFYLNNFVDPSTDSAYIKACDFILSTFSWDNAQFDFVLRLLMNTFEDSPYENVFLHLFDLYYQHGSCEGGIPDAYERHAMYIRSLKIGTIAPQLEGFDDKGQKVSLNQFLGKKVLLAFWHSKCPHCHEILPYVVSLLKHYPQVVFLTFSLDEDKQQWLAGIRELQLPTPSITDFGGYDGENALRWAVFGTPLFFVIDEEGKIKAKPRDLDELKQSLK